MNSSFRYGLIGEKLRHSYSPQIHAMLSSEPYNLIELGRDCIETFIKKREFAGVNVTIPYKKSVIPFLDQITEIAEKIGAVNTIINKDGKLVGTNTDFSGLLALIEKNEIQFKEKKVLILGSGGTSNTAAAVARHLEARTVIRVSRENKEGFVTYSEVTEKHRDAEVIINTTPVGMYPHNNESPIDIEPFTKLEAVVDVIYNPLRTKLVLEALERGIKACGGLYMLAGQGVASGELFYGIKGDKSVIDDVYKKLLLEKENIVFSGMPGCGKTTFAKGLARETGKIFVDTDNLIIEKTGMTIEKIFSERGEAYFRDMESEVVKDLCYVTGKVIALGGGTILRRENVSALKQNGKIYFLNKRSQDIFIPKGRPLVNDRDEMDRLFASRYYTYLSTADAVITLGTHKKENCDTIKKAIGITD